MDFLLKLIVVWLGVDIVIVATCWYAAALVKTFWPGWWRRVIVADEPECALCACIRVSGRWVVRSKTDEY